MFHSDITNGAKKRKCYIHTFYVEHFDLSLCLQTLTMSQLLPHLLLWLSHIRHTRLAHFGLGDGAGVSHDDGLLHLEAEKNGNKTFHFKTCSSHCRHCTKFTAVLLEVISLWTIKVRLLILLQHYYCCL